MEQEQAQLENELKGTRKWQNIKVALFLLGALLLFLFSINLMVSGLQGLGAVYANAILLATANPFNGLFIGLLMTAMLQSSSTTTALAVAFVASGTLSVEGAVPIIMGANVGTTITSTIVSLGFINKKKEFRRAVSAGTYHDFFNILTVILLFPLQNYNRFLSSLASSLGEFFVVPVFKPVENVTTSFSFGFGPLTEFLVRIFPNGLILTSIALVLVFTSIILFRKITSNLLQAGKPEAFSRFFFKNKVKSFFWGVVTTASIRSSTITTSVVVPMVAKKLVSLRLAAPFILGANMGTTITAFIAVFLYTNTKAAITIAMVHFLFNLIGILVFSFIPVIRELPFKLANRLGRLTLKYRLVGLVYLLSTFFFIPFTLIYFTQDTVQNYRMTYKKNIPGQESSYYRIMMYLNERNKQGEWRSFHGKENVLKEIPYRIDPVFQKDKTMFIGKQILLFSQKGACWYNEDEGITYRQCVEEVLPTYVVSGFTFDSVYVFSKTVQGDTTSVTHRYFFSSRPRLMLKHVVDSSGTMRELEKLVSFQEN